MSSIQFLGSGYEWEKHIWEERWMLIWKIIVLTIYNSQNDIFLLAGIFSVECMVDIG
jgi:hypothetical protein